MFTSIYKFYIDKLDPEVLATIDMEIPGELPKNRKWRKRICFIDAVRMYNRLK